MSPITPLILIRGPFPFFGYIHFHFIVLFRLVFKNMASVFSRFVWVYLETLWNCASLMSSHVNNVSFGGTWEQREIRPVKTYSISGCERSECNMHRLHCLPFHGWVKDARKAHFRFSSKDKNKMIKKDWDICAIYIILYLTKHLWIKHNFNSIWRDAKYVRCYIGNRINARLSRTIIPLIEESNQFNIQSPLHCDKQIDANNQLILMS